jgi:hypothetical protein
MQCKESYDARSSTIKNLPLQSLFWEADDFERIRKKSREEFVRSMEIPCLKSGVRFDDICNNGFFRNLDSPFFCSVYRKFGENLYVVLVKLFEALLICGKEIDVAKVLRSVLCSFVQYVEENPTERRRCGELALRLPEFADVIVVFSQLAEETSLNLYVGGIELFDVLRPCASGSFDPMKVSFRILEGIIKSTNLNDEERSEFLRIVPGAANLMLEFGHDVDRVVKLISALSTKDYGVVAGFISSFGELVNLNPHRLALKLLANDGNLGEISQFFSIIATKAKRIPFAREDFFTFISSIFEALMRVHGWVSFRQSFCWAKELIECWLIPSDEEVFSLGRTDERLFCQQVDSYKGKSDREACDFFHDALGGKGLWGMPLYMYEGIGRLLLRFGESDLMVCEMDEAFPQVQDLNFETKSYFMKPIAYKLLFLGRAFAAARQKLKILKIFRGQNWEKEEEIKGDFRDVKIYVRSVLVMMIFDIPSSKYEKVMDNWPGAFKLWVQGDPISRLLNGEEEETRARAEGLQCERNDSAFSVKAKDNREEAIRRRVRHRTVPENDQIAREYVTVYRNNPDCSPGFHCGVLALKYYLNKKQFKEARELLESILPLVRDSWPDSEFRIFFPDIINCCCEEFDWTTAPELIIGNYF